MRAAPRAFQATGPYEVQKGKANGKPYTIRPFNELVDDLFKGFLMRPVALEGRAELPRMKVDVAEKNAPTCHRRGPGRQRRKTSRSTIDGAEVTLSADVKREKEISDEPCSTPSARSQGHAQLHAAAGSGRGEAAASTTTAWSS